MKTYVVNLGRAIERKKYMHSLLKQYSFLNVEFIEAVDGRELSVSEKDALFDNDKAYIMYGRRCCDGEIGCTLSHQCCYKYIVDKNLKYSLILEDDIEIRNESFKFIEKIVDDIISTYDNRPLIILLSGGYWYTNKKKYDKEISIANIYDAYYTHSYIINNAAAKLCIHNRPFFLADDWKYIRSLGIEVLAFCPHLIDQRIIGDKVSSIYEANDSRGMHKNKMSINRCLLMYIIGGIKKILRIIGNYEHC